MKTFVITGCSRGLGLSLFKELISQGHQVAACSRSEDIIENLKKNIKVIEHYYSKLILQMKMKLNILLKLLMINLVLQIIC